jgi:hypothetical protein
VGLRHPLAAQALAVVEDVEKAILVRVDPVREHPVLLVRRRHRRIAGSVQGVQSSADAGDAKTFFGVPPRHRHGGTADIAT